MFTDNSPFKNRWLRHENGLSVEFDRTFNLKESLLVTIRERKNNFFLVEVFSKPFNTQIYGHQGTILGGLFTGMQGKLKSRIEANFKFTRGCKAINKTSLTSP